MERELLSLCGEWIYSVNGGPENIKNVPFSALCVGKSLCKKVFSLEKSKTDGKRSLLIFEGITSSVCLFFFGYLE